MKQMKISVDDVFPLKKAVKKDSSILRRNSYHKKERTDFNKILENKLHSTRNTKVKDFEEKEKINEEKLDNFLVFIQKILEDYGIKMDLGDLKIDGISNFKVIKEEFSDFLKLAGFSEDEIRKILSDMDEIKLKDFMDDKMEKLGEEKKFNINVKKFDDIKQAEQVKMVKKVHIEDVKQFNLEKVKLNLSFSNKVDKRVEDVFVNKSDSTNHFMSMDGHNLTKTESKLSDIKVLKVEKPADILKFVDFIKLSQLKGGQKLTVKLHPEHLGQMRIELHDVSGKVTAKIFVESHEAKNLLVAQTDLIRQHLESKGINFSNIDFSFFQDESNGKGNFQSNEGQRKLVKQESLNIVNENNDSKEVDALYA